MKVALSGQMSWTQRTQGVPVRHLSQIPASACNSGEGIETKETSGRPGTRRQSVQVAASG